MSGFREFNYPKTELINEIEEFKIKLNKPMIVNKWYGIGSDLFSVRYLYVNQQLYYHIVLVTKRNSSFVADDYIVNKNGELSSTANYTIGKTIENVECFLRDKLG